jgi:hypothetical protein
VKKPFDQIFGLFVLLSVFGSLMYGTHLLSTFVISPFFRSHLEIVNFISWSMQTGWAFPLMVLGFVFVLLSFVFIMITLISTANEKKSGKSGPETL